MYCVLKCDLFCKQGRQVSSVKADTKDINVMLNSKDVSEYLKLSPDGLEVNQKQQQLLFYSAKFYLCGGINWRRF